MRIFADHGQVADLRITIDSPQNPRLAFNSRIIANHSARPIDLRHIVDPSMIMMR